MSIMSGIYSDDRQDKHDPSGDSRPVELNLRVTLTASEALRLESLALECGFEDVSTFIATTIRETLPQVEG